MLGPQKCICCLLIDLENKCLKQQYILAHLILDLAKKLEHEEPPNIAAHNVICMCYPSEILPNEMKSHPPLCKQVEMFMQVRSVGKLIIFIH